MPIWAAIPAIAGALGSIFGRSSKGAADERGRENALIESQNRRQSDEFNTRQQALLHLLQMQERGTMDRAQLGISAPMDRTRQAMIGSVLQRLMPNSISGLPAGVNVPARSGGLTAALRNNPGLRMAGRGLEQQALQALLSGSDVPAMTDFRGGLLQPPQAQGYKKPGKMETIGSLGGLIGGGLGALAPFLPKPKPKIPYYDGN